MKNAMYYLICIFVFGLILVGCTCKPRSERTDTCTYYRSKVGCLVPLHKDTLMIIHYYELSGRYELQDGTRIDTRLINQTGCICKDDGLIEITKEVY